MLFHFWNCYDFVILSICPDREQAYSVSEVTKITFVKFKFQVQIEPCSRPD